MGDGEHLARFKGDGERQMYPLGTISWSGTMRDMRDLAETLALGIIVD